MNYLVFDTETTGLPPKGAKNVLSHTWPHIVSIAALLVDGDGTEVGRLSVIVRPDGWHVPQESTDVHGITTEAALADGIPLAEVLEMFLVLAARADAIVAHNMAFDAAIVGAGLARAGWKWETINELLTMPAYCTMIGGIDVTAIKTPRGYKWPKLSELHAALFGSEHTGQHSAMGDVRATVRCFLEIMRQGRAESMLMLPAEYSRYANDPCMPYAAHSSWPVERWKVSADAATAKRLISACKRRLKRGVLPYAGPTLELVAEQDGDMVEWCCYDTLNMRVLGRDGYPISGRIRL